MSYLDDLTVVVPTLNEEEAIGRVLNEVLEVGVPRDRVLVVDGGSRDKTVEIAKSKGVKVLFQKGKGKADALKTAITHVSTPYVLVMDGDYTYPAKRIPDLYYKIREGGYDLVIGARKRKDHSRERIYELGNRILNGVFNLLFGTSLSDVLSGMYVAQTRVLREVMFEMKGFSVESEIVAHTVNTSGKVVEVPVEYRKRLGKKKLRVKHGISIGVNMVRLAWRYNPTFFIFAVGSLLMIPGLLLGAWTAYHYFFTGTKYYVKGLIAVILSLAGFQSLLMAILALYLKRVEWRLTRKIENLEKESKEKL